VLFNCKPLWIENQHLQNRAASPAFTPPHMNYNHVKFLSMAKRLKTVSLSSIWEVQLQKNNSSDLEVERRVQAATKAFGAV